MITTKKPTTKSDVTRAMGAIETNVKLLVRLLGDPEEAVADEACRTLLRIGELATAPLTQAILRPTSPVQRIMAIFCVRFIHPKDSLEVQRALMKVQTSERDNRIVTLADAVRLELVMDEMENEANKARRRVTGSDPSKKIPTGSNTDS
jgi:HEAT repeat protein